MRKISPHPLKAVHQTALAALCLLILGASVIPGRAMAQQVSTPPQPVVAIHVSELTQALETMPAVPPTPTGTGTSGNQWWYTSWHYFVAYETLMEALRADGTPFVTVTDADIASGSLLNADGSPRYPILFSLDSEAIDDNEVDPLLAYVNAGGFLFVGATSFTRNTDGTTRGDFALANEMGLHMTSASLVNSYGNLHFTKTSVVHRLTDTPIPSGTLTWRMPVTADEISEGISPSHMIQGSHYAWKVYASSATVLANGRDEISGVTYPYLSVNNYGQGQIIYHGAFQPILGHGGYDPGMYAYLIVRRAIEWAFATDLIPIAKVSPWPYAYDAALIVRHDFENDQTAIDAIQASAQYESTKGVKGDYFFCTGTVREDMVSSPTPTAIDGIRTAVRSYGATIGSHNGGYKNPQNSSLTKADFDYWHWGPDEALDVTSPGLGYTSGKTYATDSIERSYLDIEGWLTGYDNGRAGCGAAGNCPRLWAAPYFNSTRDDSYDILDQLGAVVMGEQKTGPFPHKTLSYKTLGKYYSPIALPVSEWYSGSTGTIPTSLDDMTVASMKSAVDFYYSIGALVNLYGHVPSSKSGSVEQQYVSYAAAKTNIWKSNSIGIADWSIARSNISAAPVFTMTGNVSSIKTTVTVTGTRDANSAIEVVLPNWNSNAPYDVEVLRDDVPAVLNTDYRVTTYGVKVNIGSSVSIVEVRYVPAPLSSIAVSPASVLGGLSSQGTVTLGAAAPSGGITISLSSDNATAASVPSTVQVPAGSTSVSFSITTYPVASSTTATITADDGENQKTATLTVTPPVLSSFSIAPTTVLGGIVSQGTVTLTGAAPSGGLAVTLNSNHSSTASVPTSVLIPAGSTSASFTINTYPVASSTLVTISAGGGAATAMLTVTPPVLNSLSISPNSEYGGIVSRGTVTLTGAAPSGGLSVSLSSDTPTAASVPASVLVPAGSTSASFTITTHAVLTSTSVIISAMSGSTSTAQLTVLPPVLNSFAVSPTNVLGGVVSQGTVTLSGPAPAGGVSVSLSSDTPSVASVPGSVLVPAGSASAAFTITTYPVSGSTPVIITAVYGDATLTATLTIGPTALNSIAVSPASVLGGIVSQGTVTLTGAAPLGGASISLSSDNLSVAAVPTTILVPGGSTSASFTITTYPVAGSTPVTITAVYSGVTRTAPLTVGPPAVTSVAVNPASVLGGLISQGTLTLNGPAPESGLTVSLSSNTPAAAIVQATIMVPAGSTSTMFSIVTNPVSTSTPVTISASLGGTAATILTVTPPAVNAVSVSPSSVLGGIVSQGTVTLTGAAPTGGLSVSLNSNAPSAASVPASVLVPAGSTSASFSIMTYPVATSTQVTISAIFGGTATTTLTVTPPAVNALSVSPTSVFGGVVSRGTVTLTGAAPTGGLSISLSSDTPTTAGVPATVTVPAGSTSASFLITTYPVAGSTQVTISANFGGTMTALLTVAPPALNSFSIGPSNVAGGVVSHGTVTLTGAAPTGGMSVSLSSDTPTAASVPSAIVVPAGSTSAAFLITTYPVAGSTPVTITASQGGAVKTASLTVAPLALSSLTTNPVSVLGGNTSQGTVTLNGPAPNGGMSISLSSDTPTAASVPAAVLVSAGSTSATFTITTSPVAGATFVTITASDGTNQKTAWITVTSFAVSLLPVNPASVVGGIVSQGTVTLSSAAPTGGITVSLSSGVPSAASVPDSVLVPAGSTSTTFTITTYPVASSTAVTITASYGAAMATAQLTVTPPVANALSVNPSTVLGGIVSHGTVTLTGAAPSGGVSVSLSSDHPSAASVLASVLVPGGSTSASFPITTYPVASSTPVTISANFGGTATAPFTVTPPYVSSLSINPTSVLGGLVSQGTVTLTGAAPTGGLTVMLSSDTVSAASVPASVMVPAGGTSVSFTITTAPVSGSTQVAISSLCSGSTRTSLLMVSPPDGYLVGTDMLAGALKALRIAAGLDTATQSDLVHGDVAPLVNGHPDPDGKIDLADVVAILRKAAGLPSW